MSDSADKVREVTGLMMATYFSASRLQWILDHVPRARELAAEGHLLFGTMETWLIWNLTGVHVTDVTNASRTMLMNIRTLAWDPYLLELFDIPSQDAAGHPAVDGGVRDLHRRARGRAAGRGARRPAGRAVRPDLLRRRRRQVHVRHRQLCAAEHRVRGRRVDHGLIPTVAYQIAGEEPAYALEGSIAVTGSLVQWLRDGLGLISTAPEIETLASTVKDNGGCYIVPAFVGLFAPYWRSEARGVIAGLTSYVTKGHLARAALEATGWQTREVIDAMNADSGLALRVLRVDGGMTANNLLMQFIADILDTTVVRPMMPETVSLGAAYAAGLVVGFWPDLASLRRNWHRAAQWTPSMDPVLREREYDELEVRRQPDLRLDPRARAGVVPAALPGDCQASHSTPDACVLSLCSNSRFPGTTAQRRPAIAPNEPTSVLPTPTRWCPAACS